MEVSRTGMVFAGLGCPSGCDFCCTSHYFKRRHIRLLPTGQDIYGVIDRYLEIEPEMGIVVLDEDFLLNKKRAMEFRDCVLRSGRPISIFVFASIRAISQYTVTEILEMGIDGIWIGYEGTRSGYAKQKGRPVDEVLREFREHGIAVLASMIVGLPYQTPEIIEEELSGLLALRPTLSQFLIYGPTPGTPFYQRIMEKGLLHKQLTDDPERYYHSCTGFKAMVRHPGMSPEEIEDSQARCFDADFKRLGPSIYRSVETWLLGYIKLKDSPSLFLRMKAKHFAFEIRRAYPIFLAGRLLGPSRESRRGIRELQRRVHEVLGPATWTERVQSIAAAVMAAWTGLTLRLGLFQHPSLTRNAYRLPAESLPSRAWRQLRGWDPAGHRIQVELRRESTVWVQVEGKLRLVGAERLAERLREAMARTQERLVLDFKNLAAMDEGVAEKLAESLHTYRSRIRVAMPSAHEFASLAALFALYH
jgi:haloalkane dehalogenase